jgi:hypothetical protein
LVSVPTVATIDRFSSTGAPMTDKKVGSLLARADAYRGLSASLAYGNA